MLRLTKLMDFLPFLKEFLERVRLTNRDYLKTVDKNKTGAVLSEISINEKIEKDFYGLFARKYKIPFSKYITLKN